MTTLVFYLLVFLVVGSFFLFIHLMMGKVIRPAKPDSEKLTIYECGEPTVGSAWIQFDLRYYVVALLFVVFDVEVAFFFPWAVVFGNANALSAMAMPKDDTTAATRELQDKRAALAKQLLPVGLPPLEGKAPTADDIDPATAKSWAWVSFVDILVFFGVLMMGFAYLWRRGDINWIRGTAAEAAAETEEVLSARMAKRELAETM